MGRPYEIGTLSFARCRNRLALSPKERVRLILAASEAYDPDLLVTSGYAVHDRKHLARLVAAVSARERKGTIVTEVHHDGEEEQTLARQHAMYAVLGDGALYRFGRQAFGTMRELTQPDGEAQSRFRQSIAARQLLVGRHKLFALICGELNVVAGREQPRFVDPAVELPLMNADLVINPTHDRMSNAGTLDAKRRLLSRPHPDGRSRIYVSCSNWEACGLNGRVQYPSPTLHTVYWSGASQAYAELADGAFGFVYRRWRVHL